MSFQALATPMLKKLQLRLMERKLLVLSIGGGIALMLGLLAFSGQSSSKLSTDDKLLLELASMSVQLQKLKGDLDLQKSAAESQPPLTSTRRQTSSTREIVIPVQAGNAFQKVGAPPPQPYIPRGSVFQAQLLTSIKTSVQGSVVVAETTRDFEMDMRRRIPKKTRLIGQATYDPTLKGVNVRFETMTSPSGEQYDNLELLALSKQAWPLIEGIIFDDRGVQMGAALGFGFLSGFASGAQDREASVFGSVTQPSVKNQVLSGLSVASFQVAEQAIEKMKNQAFEYVVVPAGMPIYVLFNKKWIVPEGGVR
ncbi:MAG: hypothetical protein COV44_02935 [Deltaproteobacteria bacterium CG11_big_fil_rev_8_21_14_0_20_45_16]|nr:MAG: hypothetical protein COV44_02935 [Deltaproteobacteria bacterium CG11_big_fil_rev_8_21_14_0_20_45_16]